MLYVIILRDFTLNVILLSVFMQSVVMVNVIMPRALNAIMLSLCSVSLRLVYYTVGHAT
jgi:hypothetical protein